MLLTEKLLILNISLWLDKKGIKPMINRREDQMVWISCLMISVISWWLLMEETRVPVENQGPAASHRKSYEVTSKPCHGRRSN
jgi:hypothetical protein